MTAPLAQLDATIREALRPDPLRTVAEWADACRFLDRSTAAEAGRWRTERVPYMREPMEALSASSPVRKVVMQAGAQVAKTEAGLNFIGAAIDDAPGPALIVQPRDTDAEQFSKMRLAKLIQACPTLRGKVRDAARDSSNTLTLKEFPGGVLRIVGAQAPAGLRAMPVRHLFFDEVDAAPLDCGGEGDPVDLAEQRTVTFASNRKIYLCSTPTIAGHSKIEAEFRAGDQRRYHVPCPFCGAFQLIEWKRIKWPDGEPRRAWLECEHCQAPIQNHHKDFMLPRGEWRAGNPSAPADVRSYHLSGLYSPHGLGDSWGEIARRFLAAKGDPNKLKTWTNTKLGETWQAEGGQGLTVDALLAARTGWGSDVPAAVAVITAGVDVQDDRLEVEIVGWGEGEQSWSLAYEVLHGDPDGPAVWEALDHLLDTPRPHQLGGALTVAAACVDSGGHKTAAVYAYVRGRAGRNRWATIGRDGNHRPIFNNRPRRNNKGRIPLYIVGVDTAKEAIYGRLKLTEAGPGYCHFPPTREDAYFRGLTAERFERKFHRGRMRLVWTKPEGARNEPLDCRVYALAALHGWYALGWRIGSALEKLREGSDTSRRGRSRKPAAPAPTPAEAPPSAPAPPPKRKAGGWISGGQAPTPGGGGKKGGWFSGFAGGGNGRRVHPGGS